MILNTKVRYGVRTMMEIASQSAETGILQKDIAVNQGISVKYLDQIISGLKIAGLIINVKGKKTGYKLTKVPSDITIYDIWRAVQPEICILGCLSDSIECSKSKECKVRPFWKNLNTLIIDYLESTTLEQLLESNTGSCEVNIVPAAIHRPQ